jgi:hypothetical protein
VARLFDAPLYIFFVTVADPVLVACCFAAGMFIRRRWLALLAVLAFFVIWQGIQTLGYGYGYAPQLEEIARHTQPFAKVPGSLILTLIIHWAANKWRSRRAARRQGA